MTLNMNFQLPYSNFNISSGNNNASAAAYAGNGFSAASASAGSGVNNLFGGFNQLCNATGGNQQQNPMMQMFGMMMQFIQMMMQMIMQMFGMGNQQQNSPYGQQNSPYGQQNSPYGQQNSPYNSGFNNSPSAMAGLYGQNGMNTGGASAAAAASATGGSQIPQNVMNQIDSKELQAVQGQDLGAVDSKGNPKYLIAKGKRDGKMHIYKQCKEGSGKKYKCVSKVKSGNNYLYVKQPEKNREAAAAAAQSSASAASASAMSFTYNPWTGDMTFSAASAAAASASNGGAIMNESNYTTGSPLILDTNKDGKVSAQHGMGVDVNGDGKADGAATGGDKMLAMGDIDGDGQITGKEVFGNETVDPFTGQKLNAANGFDALAQVAKSAEQHTGIKCVDDNGQVDVQKLKQALEQSGKGSLGMISGTNNTTLEGLGDVSTINTSNYINQQQTGDVQHNQIGSYTDQSGNTQRVDDVWFNLA